jgi:hypothetical protein
MPQRPLNTSRKLGAVIHGSDGATVWGMVWLLANDRCEIECEQVFRCTEQLDIHVRGMGQIRGSVVSLDDGITTARLLEDCPV